MAKFKNMSDDQLLVVNRVYRAARVGLEKAVQDFGSDRFRRSFSHVMGAGDLNVVKKAEQVLEKTIQAMFMRVATVSFSVEYNANFGAHTNADMLSFGGAGIDDVTNLVDEYRSQLGNGDMMPMRLGDNFFSMDYISLSGQSQVETFLHELSHHAAGTIDDTNGGPCYEMVGIRRLKGLGPTRAVRNAENVGFFCVRYCF